MDVELRVFISAFGQVHIYSTLPLEVINVTCWFGGWFGLYVVGLNIIEDPRLVCV
jgi:hypothetical protein